MRYLNLKARAKINLTLDVLSKRDDGYHELQMIMQSVGLYDNIYIESMDMKSHIKIKTNLKWLPVDDRNIAFKAAALLKDEFKINKGVFIGLDKHIPVSAGLAGGSSDCAAVLIGMNKLFSLGLSTEELMEFGARLGSDVPYCIKRGTALAEGRGEKITSLSPCPYFYIVLAKLPVSVSTASVYGGLKLDEINIRPDTKKYIEAINNGDSDYIAQNMINVLENVTIPMVPDIDLLKKYLVKAGAENAMMSGSGPTVFALFKEKSKAIQAAEDVKSLFKIKDVFVTDIFNVK